MPSRAVTRRAPTFELERAHADSGCALIAGVDEAGRGALAGPLAVGLALYPLSLVRSEQTDVLAGIRDSKQLSPRQRERCADVVRANAAVFATTFVSHRIIDEININRATEHGIRKLLRALPVRPDLILMDGNFSFDVGVPIVSVVRGDAISLSIASASIIAKVARDAVLRTLDRRFPAYGFRDNMGYGTGAHRAAIEAVGPSPVHRLSYDPVRSLREGAQLGNEGSEPRCAPRIWGAGGHRAD